jgi:hypothetical protein
MLSRKFDTTRGYEKISERSCLHHCLGTLALEAQGPSEVVALVLAIADTIPA